MTTPVQTPPSSTVPAAPVSSPGASTPAPAAPVPTPATAPAGAPAAPATPAPAATPGAGPAIAPAGPAPSAPAGGKEDSVFGTPSTLEGAVESVDTLERVDPFAKEMGFGGVEKESAGQRRARRLADKVKAAQVAKEGKPPTTLQTAIKDVATPLPEGAEGAFTFAGKQYATQADAENRLSTLEGKLRESGKASEASFNLTKSWISHSERQEQVIRQLTSQLQGGGQVPPAEGAQPGAPATPQSASPTADPAAISKEFIQGFDWETFNDFYSDQKRGPGPALAYLADQLIQHTAKSQQALLAQIQAGLKPQLDALASERQQRSTDGRIDAAWREASQSRDQQTGEFIMPELANDPAALTEVKNLWAKQFPPQLIENENQASATMWAAYLIWSKQKQHVAAGVATSAQAAGTNAEALLNAASQGANAAAGAVGGAPVSSLPQPPSAMGGPGKPPTEEAVVKEAFRAGGTSVLHDPDGRSLGFPV